MKSKTRFIQLQFYTDYEKASDYRVIIETLDDVPIKSFVVRFKPNMQFPN